MGLGLLDWAVGKKKKIKEGEKSEYLCLKQEKNEKYSAIFNSYIAIIIINSYST